VLKALSFSATNIKDSGLVVLHNGTTPHDCFPVDLESAASMNDIIASGVLFHNCTTHHDRFRIVVLHNCTMPHDSFPVDLGSAATMNNVIASGVLFHNRTTHHDYFRVVVLNNCTTPHDSFPVDLGSTATMNDVIASDVLFTTVLRIMIVSALILANMSANDVMTTQYKWIQSALLKTMLFNNDMLEL
jgi:hypothetical protein